MKRFAPLLALFLFSCGGNPPENEAAGAARLGQAAPGFSLRSLDEKSHRLSDFKGKVVLLDFWATWCPPCRASTPALGRLHRKMAGKDFAILSISVDDAAAAVRPFLEKEKVEYLTLMADSDIQSVYRVRAIPTFVLIDARGFIAKIYQGFAPEMEVEWEKQINRLLPN
ncbi:MAG: hypothetical protein A3A86_06450 [Elusimicrobia bacterium RIFCSPLOWO2_01_FULL_60_11]|nr:MAG: hypothetical protein A3A86_06450 [Elusimicrobia bacterium RIFCSPLOWO2_01_FULL_60_11]